jgi:hypothetical protein
MRLVSCRTCCGTRVTRSRCCCLAGLGKARHFDQVTISHSGGRAVCLIMSDLSFFCFLVCYGVFVAIDAAFNDRQTHPFHPSYPSVQYPHDRLSPCGSPSGHRIIYTLPIRQAQLHASSQLSGESLHALALPFRQRFPKPWAQPHASVK